MNEKTRRIRVEFGPFRIVLEGFESSSDGVDMAVQLIRNLSAQNLAPMPAEPMPDIDRAPQTRVGQPRQNPDKPLLLQEGTRSGHSQPLAPEFHTTRLDGAPPINRPPTWQADIERLEASARRAVTALARDHEAQASPRTADATGGLPPESPRGTQAAELGGAMMQDPAQGGQTPDSAVPETETDSFSPGFVANADIQPEDSASGTGTDHLIQETMDINRRAIEQATADGSSRHARVDGISHDYLAMEDNAIDRLLETTNALLETDDHTRKNQSLDRLKAAVVATKAERRIRVKTATGTVTLDFDEKGGTRRPVADLLATPNIDPEKRRQRLQDYRQMIAEHKKRP